MIRIKCPKCASAISLDDEEAGQVGVCDACGAKFRVPAPKSAAASRSRKNEEEKRRPASRARDDEDDDEDDDEFDDEDDDEAPARGKGKNKKQVPSLLTAKNMVIAAIVAVAIVILGVGGIYIDRLGLIVTGISILLLEACALMVARAALSENTMKFLMVWFIPIYFFYYAFSNWEETHRYITAYVAFLIMTLVGGLSIYLHDGVVEANRKATRARIGLAEPVMVRILRET